MQPSDNGDDKNSKPIEEQFSSDPKDGPEERLLSKEDGEHLRNCLEKLEREDHQVFWMLKAQELSHKEVAEILQIPMGTVASKSARVPQRVRECLEEIHISAVTGKKLQQ